MRLYNKMMKFHQPYDVRSIRQASEHVGYGTIEVSTDGVPTVKNFHSSTGVTGFTPTPSRDSETLIADAQTHMTYYNDTTWELTVTNYQLNELEYLMEGWEKNAGGGSAGVIYTDLAPEEFAIQRVFKIRKKDGTRTMRAQVFYGVTSTPHDDDGATDSAVTLSRTMTPTGIDMGGKHITIFEVERDDKNAAVFDTYNSTILTPNLFSSLV